ncbi:MAG: hypothetical protein H7840_14610 [Alphaproteobacteria bacterium]
MTHQTGAIDVEQDAIVTQAELARRLGVTRGRVSQLRTKGMPTRPDGRVVLADAMAWLDANLDPTRRKNRSSDHRGDGAPTGETVRQIPSPLPAGDYLSAKTVSEELKGQRLALLLEKERGCLVDRDEVERTIFTRARLEREAHQNFVVRAAPLMAAELGVGESDMLAVLDRHMRQHLAELADMSLEVLDGHGSMGG